MCPSIQSSCNSISTLRDGHGASRVLTLHHPRLSPRQANNRGDTQSCDGRNSLVHRGICEGVITGSLTKRGRMRCRELESPGEPAACLPSILPCSQSTITQSAPDLARILEMLAPG